ncbi:MAG: GntR family transcriptional regulator [Alphaproteobacteria bacterium]|nr:GntR family transcriptional regulator [Alphaproteobacteria bacterium]
MTKPTIRNNDAEAAYEIIMDAIVTQRLTPSQKVSENIFSDMFAISRTISRNLIERLIAQRFLVSLSPRVTQVAPLTLLEIKQNFVLRKIFIPEIVSLAGARVDFRKLTCLSEKIQKLLPITDDRSALRLLKANKELNLAFCDPSGYPLLCDWAHQLENTAMRIYWLYVKTKKKFPYDMDQQNILFEIMKSDEPEKIHKAVLDIIIRSEERILNAVFSHEQFYTQDLLV